MPLPSTEKSPVWADVKVAAYGGTFDPPTFGHLAALQTLIAAGYNVLVHPVGEFHAFGKTMSKASSRMAWMKAFIREAQKRKCLPLARIEVVDLTLFGAKKEETSTYAMLPALRLAARVHFGTSDVAVTIGSDQANCLDRWEHPDALKAGKLVIIERGEMPISPETMTWAQKHVILPSSHNTGFTSSSLVRRLIGEGKIEEACLHTYPFIVEAWSGNRCI